jgi:hypothetical protein
LRHKYYENFARTSLWGVPTPSPRRLIVVLSSFSPQLSYPGLLFEQMSYNMHCASIVHVASRLPLGAQDKDTASAKIAERDPRMRRAIVAHLDASSGAGLDPAPRKAVGNAKIEVMVLIDAV